jgi:nitrite reductase/ring-hydroxylating ferredoxin subunit
MQQLCTLQDLEKHSGFSVNVGGQRYLVVVHENQVHAFINSCPHLAIPLEWQEHDFWDEDTGLIRCSNHGALFLPDTGECVSGPCFGQTLQPVSIVVDGNNILLGC